MRGGSIIYFLVFGYFISLGIKPLTARAQEPVVIKNTEELTFITGEMLGGDDLLIKGRFYSPLHPQAKGDPYFGNNAWNNGTLVLYGKIYTNILMKYDLEINRLVILINDNMKNQVPVLPDHGFIDSFTMEGHTFNVNTKTQHHEAFPGFHESVNKGKLTLQVTYEKHFINEYNHMYPFGRYSDLKEVRTISDGHLTTEVNTMRSFLEYFKNDKKDIREFMKRNQIIYRKASIEQLRTLMDFCNDAYGTR